MKKQNDKQAVKKLRAQLVNRNILIRVGFSDHREAYIRTNAKQVIGLARDVVGFDGIQVQRRKNDAWVTVDASNISA